MKKMILVATFLSFISVLGSPVMAGVKGGALLDSNNQPVKAGQDKCVTVADGKFSSSCHIIKAREVPKSS